MSTEREEAQGAETGTTIDTIIVGASAAGLATAACLRKAGAPFVLLEQALQIAPAWRTHYDRLRLHTSKGLSGLPHHAFPRRFPRYPSRDEVVAYLEEYAERFALRPRFGQRVVAVQRSGDDWTTRTEQASYRSRNVVIATGHTRVPHEPRWPGLDRFGGPVIHSSAYRNARAWPGQRVLVVGIGNSGAEIALDLHENGAHVALAVRGPVNVIPRQFLGLPIVAWGIALGALPDAVGDAVSRVVSRLCFGRLDRIGLRAPPYGVITQIRRHGRLPVLDVGTLARIRRRQIAIRPDIESFAEGRVRFRDGADEPFDAVVLATGYRADLGAFIDASVAAEALDPAGLPARDKDEVLPGLFFCGFHASPGGMLRAIGREAKRIARRIAARRGGGRRLLTTPFEDRSGGHSRN
jgi:cation diffusion facilitator CzcD-associated flavoprotein CzcO